MRNGILGVIAALLLAGCTPKIGEDFLLEPEGNVRWESGRVEAVLGVLTLLGLKNDAATVKIGSDLRLSNRWHSDLKIVSLSYTLLDHEEKLARGEARINPSKPLGVMAGGSALIPLTLEVDTRKLDVKRLSDILEAKRNVRLRGEAVVEVWGMQKRYPFEREAGPLLQKALKKAGF